MKELHQRTKGGGKIVVDFLYPEATDLHPAIAIILDDGDDDEQQHQQQQKVQLVQNLDGSMVHQSKVLITTTMS